MEKQYLEDGQGGDGTLDIKMDDTIWKELPHELVEKCLSHLPILTIASTLKGLNKMWRSYPGTSTFMALHNHMKNIESCFRFLMFGTNILTHQCETMVLDHNTLKWQSAPSLQLHGSSRTCKVESTSEGMLCLSPHPTESRPFVVWNPLLPSSCSQTINRMAHDDYWSVNLVVNKTSTCFKILAFTSWFQGCHIYSSTTSLWRSHEEGPKIDKGLFFPSHKEGRHIAVTYQNCFYVAIASIVDDVHQVGDLCYDANKEIWKTSTNMFTLPQEIMNLYRYCFTRSLFVVSNTLYKVVEYVSGVQMVGDTRPSPTLQILARSLSPQNNAEQWRLITTTTLPQSNWETKWFGSWYGYIPEGHQKPTLCGLFKSEPSLFLMMYNTKCSKWKTLCVTNKATSDIKGSQDPIGIMVHYRNSWRCEWALNKRKWLSMSMVPNYEPSWICPSRDCMHRFQTDIRDLYKL